MVACRTALWLLPFRIVHRNLTQRIARRAATEPHQSAQRIAWAVEVTARRVPGASCLTQALAASWLLSRDGYQPVIRIGVRRDPAGLRAHAWVDVDGVTLIGGSVDEFALLDGVFSPPAAPDPSQPARTTGAPTRGDRT